MTQHVAHRASDEIAQLKLLNAELLEALKKIHDLQDRSFANPRDLHILAIDTARDAIAKAEGR
jgi:hypothetical protein